MSNCVTSHMLDMGRLDPSQITDPVKTEGHWEYYDVVEKDNYWQCKPHEKWIKIWDAMSMIGFDGVFYGGDYNCWFPSPVISSATDWHGYHHAPTMVRFWRKGYYNPKETK